MMLQYKSNQLWLENMFKVVDNWAFYHLQRQCYSFLVRSPLSWYSFPGGPVVKNPPASTGDMGLIPVKVDPTCCGVTKPVHHNFWACSLEPACLQPELCSKRRHREGSPCPATDSSSHSSQRKPARSDEGPGQPSIATQYEGSWECLGL